MKVIIAKIGEVLFEGEAYSLTAPGASGEMTVLGHHEPLVTTLKPGEARVRTTEGAEPQVFPISGGILEINAAGATILL